MPDIPTFAWAFAGGLLPALFWLWFWLKEDRRCPEPKGYILLAFIVGMIVVPLVLPVERYIAGIFAGMTAIILWSAVEELFKFIGVRLTVLRRTIADEPTDMVIYMITVALGFAALENTFFLLNPLAEGSVVSTILTGNLRFVGATLLHVLSSATVGVALAFAFYKSPAAKRLATAIGLILAIVLHAVFNLLIITSKGEYTFAVFVGVWIGIIALLLFFERVKRIHKPGFSITKGC